MPRGDIGGGGGARAAGHEGRSHRLVRFLLRLLLVSPYRSIEVVGGERVAPSGALILVANHNDSLVDPMALLVAVPRAVALLAKAPLWRSRLLRPFLDALGAIPVFRPQDAAENEGRGARANVETFRRCGEHLEAGGALALFPEGVSQPQPRLLPLRTGAARIALDAPSPVTVVPVALVKGSARPGRRRTLLVRIGQPIAVAGAQDRGSRRSAIAGLTRRIEAELRDLLAEADSQGELEQLRALRMVWEQERGLACPASLAEGHERDRAFARGLARLRQTNPPAVDHLRAGADAWMRALDLAGIPPQHVGRTVGPRQVLRFLLLEGPLLLVAVPIGWLAAIVTWPVRRVGDLLALRTFGGAEDLRALCRMLGGAVLLVLVAAGLALLGGILSDAWLVLAALVGLPALLAFHIAWHDRRLDALDRTRGFFLLAGSRLHANLLGMRRDLCREIEQARRPLDTDG